ncbi:SDR family NAD(P)-dependent oxidoreductase [Actinocrispum wychmicini]|uniref:SDR family NAD(P)-dependent oxidoreductase n=1 Tax=Actinocrispum wychmicini TaxID=1213861 RepID=UPI00104AC561
MRASRGSVINVSSVAGRQARLGSVVYNASKRTVGAFTESLRQLVTAVVTPDRPS